jgi:2-dehydropantoate 2-reductase
MRIAVMGTGAVGGYFGGMLAKAGHSVSFIARDRQAKAIAAGGLNIRSSNWQCTLKVPQIHISSDPSLLANVEGVLLCVKSTDTEDAALQMRAHLPKHCWVMSLQNGVDNPIRAQQVLDRLVIPAVVYVATAMPEPGLIEHFGRGDLVIGLAKDPNTITQALLAHIRESFMASGIPVEVSDKVQQALWAKLLVNCTYNAISALAQVDYGTLAAHSAIQQTMRAVIEEVVAVSAAAGVNLDLAQSIQICEKIAEAMPKQLSSTAQDIARKKRSEIDHLNGFVVREGQRLSVATPVNQTLHALVKLIESEFSEV